MSARTAAPFLVALALLTACGGTSGSGGAQAAGKPTAAPPAGLSKATYLSRSEDVCSRANSSLDELPAPKTGADIEQYVSLVLLTVGEASDELQVLAEHQPDKADLDRIFLGPLAGQLKAFQAYAPRLHAALGKGPAAIKALGQPVMPQGDPAAMRAYGFKACVQAIARAD